MEKPHEIENKYILELIQAMIGGISNNFRAIWIITVKEKLDVYFLLEKDNAEDRGEIEDFIFEFEALQEKIVDVTPHVLISKKPWTPPTNARILFSMRK